MNNISKYFTIGIALLASVTLFAQNDGKTYNSEGGVSTAKSVTANDDGSYTISLETFAYGTSTLVTTSTPVDVVLVLDRSNSMGESYTYNTDDGQKTGTRLEALQYAVGKFVDEIARNDAYDDNNNPRDKVLGNRIQIVTFCSSVSTLFNAFQPASANASSIKTAVNGISPSQGTRTDSGMSTASTWVTTSNSATYWTDNNLKDDNDHNVVVVMFTDGCPSTSGQTNFTASYAISAVNTAKTIKDNGATVYSVGLINWSNLSTANQTYVRNMMDYISSNFPDGQASATNTFTCTGNRASSDYYKDANETDLTDIFESIAQSSGGSAETIGSSTEVRDVVTSSFTLPEGADADDIEVAVYKISSDGTSWTEDTSYDTSGISPVVGTNAEGNSTVTVKGFDYSMDDTTKGAGDGNWVGIRYDSGNHQFYAGRKTVISFKIIVNDGDNPVTGGGTETNTADSGVYVLIDGEYVCVNHYTKPATTLSVTIVINKTGLRHGESATFEIGRCRPKNWDESKSLEDNIAAIEYNAIGKPVPSLAADADWGNWSKVILTNKGADNALVTRTLVALDPYWVYKVEEDDWGWAYDLTGTATYSNTSEIAINPFNFTNKEKEAVVKHAEAVTINHFATSASGTAKEEHYSSSKVESF